MAESAVVLTMDRESILYSECESKQNFYETELIILKDYFSSYFSLS